MSFDDFPQIKRILKQYDGVMDGKTFVGFLRLKRMESDGNRAVRAAEAATKQFASQRVVWDEALKTVQHQVDTVRKARELSQEYQRIMSGQYDQQALPGGTAQRQLGPGPSPIVTVVSRENIEQEAKAVLAGFPGEGSPAAPAYLDGHIERMRVKGYSEDAIRDVCNRTAELLAEKESRK